MFVYLQTGYDRVPREEVWYSMRKSCEAGARHVQ